MSQLNCPGPRSLIVRLTFPKVKAGAVEKASLPIQLSRRWPTTPAVCGEAPVALGRWLALNIVALLLFELCEMTRGKPDEITVTKLIAHPPMARSATRLTLPRN